MADPGQKQREESVAERADLSCRVSEDGRTLTVSAENVTGISAIRAAVWSRTNGQNDLRWYDLVGAGAGTMRCTVDLLQHGSSDLYYVHVYTGNTILKA